MNERRERRFENLLDATGEGTKSGALDTAADYYIRMAGNNPGVPTGRVAKLMEIAEEKGSVTPQEIAEVLNTDELSVMFSSEWEVGSN